MKLASIVENESEDVPSEEDCAKYLQEMEMLKLQNEQSKLLGIIDTIINMMKEGRLLTRTLIKKFQMQLLCQFQVVNNRLSIFVHK